MGGDDLESDDDYLAPVIAGPDSDTDDDSNKEGKKNMNSSNAGGTKRQRGDDHDDDDDDEDASLGDEDEDDTNTQPKKKQEKDDELQQPPISKKQRQQEGKLRELAHGLEHSTTETQASFLTQWTGTEFLSRHLIAVDEDTLVGRIPLVISKKKLKQWNIIRSPMIIIVCLSARRAVTVLKELARYKLRIAKLFAKHMTIEQQETMLQSTSFPIAVGTPHRLLTLATCTEGSTTAALSLSHTKLIVLDGHVNPKKYTVCTLPDTAPHVQDFLLQKVHPELQRRNDIHISFL